MNRRRSIVLFSLSAALLPASAFAQQKSKLWRVGILGSSARLSYLDEFPGALRALGYEEGKNLVIDWRFANGQYDRLPALASDLVGKGMDVIVVASTPAAKAARAATSTTPIVMMTVGDPVGSGLVASLARPGGNVTGLSLATTAISTKWLELAMTVVPHCRAAVLADSGQPTVPMHTKNIEAAAQKLGTRIPMLYARASAEIESAFAAMSRERAQCGYRPAERFF